MKPKKNDSVFITNCSLINKQNFTFNIEQVFCFEDRILVKGFDILWFDITFFKFDKKNKYWKDVNSEIKDVVLFEQKP